MKKCVHNYKENYNQFTLFEMFQTVLIANGGEINNGPGEQQIRLVVFLSVTTLNDPYNIMLRSSSNCLSKKQIYKIIIFGKFLE